MKKYGDSFRVTGRCNVPLYGEQSIDTPQKHIRIPLELTHFCGQISLYFLHFRYVTFNVVSKIGAIPKEVTRFGYIRPNLSLL